MNLPKLSVIIPTKNEEKYLPRLLKSLKEQTLQPYEVIVADCSKDSTLKIAQQAGYKTISVKPTGPASNRNAGASKAGGDVLFFVDADSHFGKNFLQNVLTEFVKKKVDIGMVQFRLESPNPVTRLIGFTENAFTRLLQWIRPFSHGFSIICTKKMYEEICGFDESLKMGEDVDFGYRGSKQGKFRVLVSDKIIVSGRRFDEEGPIKLFIKLFYSTIKIALGKEIKKDDKITYEFGKHGE